MRSLNEVEAAQALGEMARDRRQAGRPGLGAAEPAFFLRALREVRSLPEFNSPASATRPTSIPRQRVRI
ncbi:MAG: hypothetical protein QOC80_164, partial [Frankiaceae bacterium]|nr:hypothetical protein [Frankiaceae bacterium]